MSLPDYIVEIKDFLIKNGFPEKIEAVVILGSGLGDFGDEIQNQTVIPYSDIPNFPQSTVQGHSGALIFGEVEGKTTLAFSGRFHFYEGYGFDKTVIPVHLAYAFNADKLLVSNAAGGINLDFRVGDLMVIEDIIKQNMDLKAAPSSKKWSLDLYPIADRVQEIARWRCCWNEYCARIDGSRKIGDKIRCCFSHYQCRCRCYRSKIRSRRSKRSRRNEERRVCGVGEGTG